MPQTQETSIGDANNAVPPSSSPVGSNSTPQPMQSQIENKMEGTESNSNSAQKITGNTSAEHTGPANDRKRKRNFGADNSFPKTRDEMTPEQLKQRIKRQIEYYFSDESLTFDSFFQGKMREAAREGKGEVLDIRFVLSSPRIKALNLTKAEIIAAIVDSTTVKAKEESNGSTWLYREAPLPELKERSSRAQDNGLGGRHFHEGHSCATTGIGKDPHAAGVFLKLKAIPQSVTQW